MSRTLFDLSGCSAIVTGGSKGIGRAIAQVFHDYGAKVAIVGASKQVFATAEEMMADGGQPVYPFQADLKDRDALPGLFEGCMNALGSLEILVNNAGIFLRSADLLDYPMSDWDTMFQVNVDTVFMLCQMAARVMLPKQYGRIINISSVSGLRGDHPCYGATKGAVIALTRSLSNSLAKHGITVNSIAPGFIATELAGPSLQNEERMRCIYRRTATPRIGKPEDLQGAALLLASRESGYITGETIAVDGGHLQIAYQEL